MGCIRRRRLQGEGHDPLHIGVRDGAWAAGPRLVKQAVEAAFDEPGPPLPHRLLGQTDLPGHDGIGLALGATENDPGSQSQRLGSGWTPLPALEALAFVGGKCKGGMGRPMAMVTSMSVSWRVHPSKYFCNEFITQDTSTGRMLDR